MTRYVRDMEERELKELVSEAVRDAEVISEKDAQRITKELLLHIGLDPAEFSEIRQDFYFLRTMRKGGQAFKKAGMWTAIGTFVTGLLVALWIGIVEMIKRG